MSIFFSKKGLGQVTDLHKSSIWRKINLAILYNLRDLKKCCLLSWLILGDIFDMTFELTKLRRSFLAWLVVQTTHKNYHTRHINVHRYIRRRREKYFSKGKKKNHHDSGCSVNLSHPYKLFYTLSLQKEKFLFSRWSHPFSLVVFSYLQFSRNAYCSHYLTSNLRCD